MEKRRIFTPFLRAADFEQDKGELLKKIALYFLESGIIGATEVKESAFEVIKEGIRTVASGIRKQDYRATPAYMACNYCAYNQICPHTTVV